MAGVTETNGSEETRAREGTAARSLDPVLLGSMFRRTSVVDAPAPNDEAPPPPPPPPPPPSAAPQFVPAPVPRMVPAPAPEVVPLPSVVLPATTLPSFANRAAPAVVAAAAAPIAVPAAPVAAAPAPVPPPVPRAPVALVARRDEQGGRISLATVPVKLGVRPVPFSAPANRAAARKRAWFRLPEWLVAPGLKIWRSRLVRGMLLVLCLVMFASAVLPFLLRLRPRSSQLIETLGVISYPHITITAPQQGTVDKILASPGALLGSEQAILVLHTNWQDSATPSPTDQQTELDQMDKQISDLESQRAALNAKGDDAFYRIELEDVAARLDDLRNRRDTLATQVSTSNYAPISDLAAMQTVTPGRPSRLVQLLVGPGATVVRGESLVEVGDCGSIFAEAPTAALNAAGLYGGDEVNVLLTGDPEPVRGVIERTGPGSDSGRVNAQGQALTHIDLIVGKISGVWGSCPAGSSVTITSKMAS